MLPFSAEKFPNILGNYSTLYGVLFPQLILVQPVNRLVSLRSSPLPQQPAGMLYRQCHGR